MRELRKLREAAGLSQYELARCAGLPRMRLQLAESKHVTLRSDGIDAVHEALRGAIQKKLAALRNTLGGAELLKEITTVMTQEGQADRRVRVCTSGDLAALRELYAAAYPWATAANRAVDIRSEEADSWITYNDEHGTPCLAIQVRDNGYLWLLVRAGVPDSMVTEGVIALAQEAWKVLAPSRILTLTVVHSPHQRAAVEALETAGLLSRELGVIRTMFLTENLSPGQSN